MTMHPAITALSPEIVLSLAAVCCLFLGMSRRGGLRAATPTAALLGLAASLCCAAWLELQRQEAVVSLVRDNDPLLWYVRLLTAGMGVLIVLVNRHVPADGERGEYFCLLLFSLVGLSLTAAADDLLLLFLAIELVSVPTYILIGLSRTNPAVQEATVKYFFLGAFAAALTLYGFSFLYGAAGTTAMMVADESRRSIEAALSEASPSDLMVRIGLLLALSGLAFKIAAVPFHFYVADVYQGAASPVSGMLGFVPKLAGFVALIRILDLTGWRHDATLFWLLWALAAATMTAGNTLALMQRQNVKRVLAYSSIAHSGYMLLALLAGPGGSVGLGMESPLRNGVAALLFYIVIYGLMNLGAFAALAFFRSRATGEPVETFDDLSAAARERPWAAGSLAVCALGLMGLPPTAGMLGKLYLFSSALSSPEGATWRGPLIVLVVIGVINAAIGAVYYLRIASACMLGERREDVPSPTSCDALRMGLLASAVLVIAAFIWPGPLLRQAQQAAARFHARPVTMAAQDAQAAR